MTLAEALAQCDDADLLFAVGLRLSEHHAAVRAVAGESGDERLKAIAQDIAATANDVARRWRLLCREYAPYVPTRSAAVSTQVSTQATRIDASQPSLGYRKRLFVGTEGILREVTHLKIQEIYRSDPPAAGSDQASPAIDAAGRPDR